MQNVCIHVHIYHNSAGRCLHLNAMHCTGCMYITYIYLYLAKLNPLKSSTSVWEHTYHRNLQALVKVNRQTYSYIH